MAQRAIPMRLARQGGCKGAWGLRGGEGDFQMNTEIEIVLNSFAQSIRVASPLYQEKSAKPYFVCDCHMVDKTNRQGRSDGV